jgi:hypothetical protein
MRPLLVLSVITLSACGPPGSVIEGSILDPDDANIVFFDQVSPGVRLDGTTFQIRGVRGHSVELRFQEDDRERGVMTITGLRAGSQLVLHGVWIEDRRAFPSSISMPDGGLVTVNGLRMTDPKRIPRSLATSATILSRTREGDGLFVRPVESDMPDLRVLIGPQTRIVALGGDPLSLRDLEFGDSVRIEGESVNGYVMAREVTVPQRGGESEPRAATSPDPLGSGTTGASVGSAPTGGSTTPAAQPRAAPRPEAPARRPGPPGRGLGRGRGQGRNN